MWTSYPAEYLSASSRGGPMLRASERDHPPPSTNPPTTPGLRRGNGTPNEVLGAVISSGSTAGTVDISTRAAMMGLDPRPLRGGH
jgi:hypothetical protein